MKVWFHSITSLNRGCEGSRQKERDIDEPHLEFDGISGL